MEMTASVSTLSLSLINCLKCNDVLVMPIMAVSNLGNVCGLCYKDLYKISHLLPTDIVKDNRITKEDVVRSTENTSLKEFFEAISLPCCYKYKGCPEVIRFDSMRSHKEECTYNNFSCTIENCEWQGKEKHFLGHFKDSHNENVITNEDDVFDISFPPESKDFTTLFESSFGEFMCRIGIAGDIVKFVLYNVDQFKNILRYESHVTCKISATETFIITHKISKEMREVLEFEGKEVVTQKIANSEKSSPCFSISFILDGYEIKVNNSLADIFKCAACSKYLQLGWKICLSEHIICSSCPSKLFDRTCSVKVWGHSCSKPLIECVPLNRLQCYVRLPCMNASKGCKVKSFPKSNHLALCRYQ